MTRLRSHALASARLTRKKLLVTASLLMCSLAATAARADSGSDKAAAEALFDEGRALMRDGKFAMACPKFAESQRLDPGVGTLMYLGACYEKLDKVASAWATFREAAAAAQNAGQGDRQKLANSKADALDAMVPRLTVVTDAAQSAPSSSGGTDLEVTLDGKPFAPALWGAAIPVDPGPHRLDWRATGKRPATLELVVAKADRKRIELTPLAAEPTVQAPPTLPTPSTPIIPTPPASPEPADNKTEVGASPLRWVGLGVAGAGLVGIGVGSVFGLRAMSLADDVNARCPSGPCSSEVKQLAEDSRSAGTLSTVAFVAGGTLLAGGALLWLFAPRSRPANATVSAAPVFERGRAQGGSLVVGGTF